jgi:hypothetical protein
MKNKLARIGLVILAIVLASSYDLWRGYHEEGSIGAGIGFAVLGWITFGVIFGVWALVSYMFGYRDGKSDGSTY